MSEVLLLFAVLALLYLWECACWLSPGSLACLSWLGKNWRLARPGQFFGNQQGGFVLIPPLPPLGSILIGNHLPFALSPQGIFIADNSFFPFAEIKSVEAKNHKVFINGVLALKLPTQPFAIFVTRLLLDVKNEKPDRRADLVERIFQMQFDTKTMEILWAEFQKHTKTIQWLANGLFFFLFVLTPALIMRLGLAMTWPALVSLLIAFTSSLAVKCYQAHKRLFPAADDDRFTHTVTVLLAPATAIRARDALSRRLLETYHPLALAFVFCPAEKFRAFAEKTLRDLRYSMAPAYSENEASRKEAETFSRQALLSAMENFLRWNKTDPDDLCAAPKREATCNSYCPRCLTQFTTTDGQCADCSGVPLVAFSASSEKK